MGYSILKPTMRDLKFFELRGDASIKDGSFEIVRQLRYRVLREPLGMPFESTLFDGDDLNSTIHIVSYREDSSLHEPIGCLSLLIPTQVSDSPEGNGAILVRAQSPQPPALRVQLRGMAVLQSYQGLGSRRSAIRDAERSSSAEFSATCSSAENDQLEVEYNACEPRVGVGGELLNYVHRMAKLHGWELWCNARESAVSFYAKYGWRVEGEPFEIPKIGPHYVMRWNY
ncbi:MAG: GNAT family N-acetyltransferase [Pirellula sp.]|jgi:hypothetical protein